MLTGMQRELSFHPEVQLQVLNARANYSIQTKQIQALKAGETDLLIITPCEGKGSAYISAAVEDLYGQGIPVVVLDQPLTSRLYTAFVGGSNNEIGQAAARCAASLVPQNGKIIELTGAQETRAATERHQGFANAVKTYSNLQLVGQVSSQWQPFNAKADLVGLLNAHPEVNLLFAHSDYLALAAYRVCRELGRDKQIRIIGVNGRPGPEGGIGLVQDGVLAATVLNLPGGEEAMRLALRILNHEPFERKNILATTIIDSRNVLMMRQQTDRLALQQQDIERQQTLLTTLQATFASQRVLLYSLLGALLAVASFGTMAWRASRQQRHLNDQLTLRNQENDRINAELAAQNGENTRINAELAAQNDENTRINAELNAQNDENQRINQQLTVQNEEISTQRNQLEIMAAQARADTEAKLRFFTNFSHELRTPLTLIMGPVEELMSSKSSFTAAQHHDLMLVNRNTQRLLKLVNQLMDFRRIEVGKMPVQATEGNLVTFVREIVDMFERPATLRGIRLHWLPAEPMFTAWFDANVLDKVLFNLLSNALKFTPEKGEITVRMQPGDAAGRSVRISVADTGPGIGAADQDHIFEWFYQGQADGMAKGSGLGLALALGLTRLHRGQLTVQSEPGKGTTFELTLPRDLPIELHAPDTVPVLADDLDGLGLNRKRSLAIETSVLSPEPSPLPASRASDALVLVIEDNPEVNDFLVRKLSPEFEVQAAADGLKGFEMATDLIPDLIVCDVMMPGLSGLEVVARLRDDWRTSHIPVILLTARGAPEQQIEGVQVGADLYLTKPFHPAFLLESIRTLLANRERQRAHFRRELNLDKTTPAPTRPDQRFLTDLMAIIEANLSRPELSVEDVGRSLNLSRMQLYRKVKALLGMGLAEYIQGIRLAKARQLLLNDSLTIAEVGYELGFASPSYFGATFKAKYQVSPSEFRAMHPTVES